MEKTLIDSVKQFFSPKDDVHQHWYCLLDNFQFASDDFYHKIEKELAARKVPNLEMSRPELSEGGLLSDKRVYLRLKRERLVFDICAAPFGTSYFFSFRFVELALGIKIWELAIFLVVFVIWFALSINVFGFIMGLLSIFVTIGVVIYLMGNVSTLGLGTLDTDLLKVPVIGPIYEVFFRKETYYRQDTRLMYMTTVNSITEMIVDEVTASKGIKLVKRYDRRPISGELYQERIIPSGEKRPEPPLEKPA